MCLAFDRRTSVSDIDCAVLAIPGAAVVASVRACARKGMEALIVFAAGFAETGEEGQAAQRELASIAQEHGMIIEGPNCLGMVNYATGFPLTFVVTPPQERTHSQELQSFRRAERSRR